ncbi:hypothetical protein quinque_009509 [Culex quinquefasciatus]
MSNIDISTTAAAAKASWTNAARQQLVVRLGVWALVLGLLGSSVTTVGVAAEGNIASNRPVDPKKPPPWASQ